MASSIVLNKYESSDHKESGIVILGHQNITKEIINDNCQIRISTLILALAQIDNIGDEFVEYDDFQHIEYVLMAIAHGDDIFMVNIKTEDTPFDEVRLVEIMKKVIRTVYREPDPFKVSKIIGQVVVSMREIQVKI